jgi:acyl-CoA thioesterase
MIDTPLPEVLQVEHLGGDRWTAPHPDDDPENRDVVFGGQLLGQMIMVASAGLDGAKEVKSIHAVFARAGAYSAGPVEFHRDPMHSGRAWASATITGSQGDRLLSRALVLLNAVEPDLIRHAMAMPDVPGPEECDPAPIRVVYPGSEVRPVSRPEARSADGAPVSFHWVRPPGAFDTVAANQAVVAWSQPGFTIGTAMQAHPDTVRISDAHRTISTGVISHTTHFHDHPTPGDWLLVVSAAAFAGNGRVFGNGSVFTTDGTLVSTFGQDAMVRKAEAPIATPRTSGATATTAFAGSRTPPHPARGQARRRGRRPR